jgi:hypothetical protein
VTEIKELGMDHPDARWTEAERISHLLPKEENIGYKFVFAELQGRSESIPMEPTDPNWASGSEAPIWQYESGAVFEPNGWHISSVISLEEIDNSDLNRRVSSESKDRVDGRLLNLENGFEDLAAKVISEVFTSDGFAYGDMQARFFWK